MTMLANGPFFWMKLTRDTKRPQILTSSKGKAVTMIQSHDFSLHENEGLHVATEEGLRFLRSVGS